MILRRNLLLLLIAIVIASLLSYLILTLLNVRSGSQIAQDPIVSEYSVLVASKPLVIGTILNSRDTEWKAWPREALNSGFIIEGTRDLEKLYGSVVIEFTAAGKPITDDIMVHPQDGGYLASIIRPGKRAISIEVDIAAGKASLITPGDHVDIILTSFSGDRSNKKTKSKTILSNIRVLATDRDLIQDREGSYSPSEEDIEIVTIEVSPDQAEIIAEAINVGKLSLSIRGIGAAELDDQFLEEAIERGIINITIIRGTSETKSVTEPGDFE